MIVTCPVWLENIKKNRFLVKNIFLIILLIIKIVIKIFRSVVSITKKILLSQFYNQSW